MKVCSNCNEEIDGKDGDNFCFQCEQEEKKQKRNKKARERRANLNEVYSSLGLQKVRGALGGTYWE